MPSKCSRRSLLTATGVGLSLAVVGTTPTSVQAANAEDDAPAVDWLQTYPGQETEYEHTPYHFQHTADGGYVLGGMGAPIHESGPERTQFSCARTDEAGDLQWIAFGLDDHELELDSVSDILELPAGGFVLVGGGQYTERDDPEERDEHISRAVKFGDNGGVEWTVVFDQFEDEEALEAEGTTGFRSLTPAVDGDGPIAVGFHHNEGVNGWAVKFDDDGGVEWRRNYQNHITLERAFTTEHGYLYSAPGTDDHAMLRVDPTGNLEAEIDLDIDRETIPHNHVVIPTQDGGFALTGRHKDMERMVLQKLSASGDREWLETYNGPYDGYDWAFDLVQTNDAGYALFGHMEAAYTGEKSPAVLKTDETGTEEWRTLLEDHDWNRYLGGTQTQDGGYAAFDSGSHHVLAKYEPSTSDDDDTSGDEETDDEEQADSDEDSDEAGEDDEQEESTDEADEDDSSGEEGSTESTDDEDENDSSGEEGSTESTDNEDENDSSGEEGSTESSDDTEADGSAEEGEDDSGTASEDETGDDGNSSDDSGGGNVGETSNLQEESEDEDDQLPGFGVGAAIASVFGGAGYYLLRDSEPDGEH